jgi:DNA-binding transcriptional regulator YiaG
MKPKDIEKLFNDLGWDLTKAAYEFKSREDTLRKWFNGTNTPNGPAMILLLALREAVGNGFYPDSIDDILQTSPPARVA